MQNQVYTPTRPAASKRHTWEDDSTTKQAMPEPPASAAQPQAREGKKRPAEMTASEMAQENKRLRGWEKELKQKEKDLDKREQQIHKREKDID